MSERPHVPSSKKKSGATRTRKYLKNHLWGGEKVKQKKKSIVVKRTYLSPLSQMDITEIWKSNARIIFFFITSLIVILFSLKTNSVRINKPVAEKTKKKTTATKKKIPRHPRMESKQNILLFQNRDLEHTIGPEGGGEHIYFWVPTWQMTVIVFHLQATPKKVVKEKKKTYERKKKVRAEQAYTVVSFERKSSTNQQKQPTNVSSLPSACLHTHSSHE